MRNAWMTVGLLLSFKNAVHSLMLWASRNIEKYLELLVDAGYGPASSRKTSCKAKSSCGKSRPPWERSPWLPSSPHVRRSIPERRSS